jgi:hypothetical protein
MFSGGEKKSFYKLYVGIGTIITALELKQTNPPRAKLYNFLLFLFFTLKSGRKFDFFLF